MKKKQWLKIGIFAVIAAAVVAFSAAFLQVNNARDTLDIYSYYLEPEDSIDVALIGTSTIYTSFYCPLAYEKYGFTSFPLATSAMRGSTVKYAVKMIEERHSPDLYIIDAWTFNYKDQYDETNLRKVIDSIQSKQIREEAIEDLVPDELKDSFKYPFLKYHANWAHPRTCIRAFQDKMALDRKGYSVTKGFSTYTNISKEKTSVKKYKISKEGLSVLEDFLGFLKDEGIKNVLFIRGVEMEGYKTEDSYYKMIDMIEDAGFDFYNVNDDIDDIGIDYDHDFYNDGHVNIFGTEKFTDYFGKYIMDNYDINTEHREDIKKEWDDCAANNEKMIKKLKEETEKKENENLYMQSELVVR